MTTPAVFDHLKDDARVKRGLGLAALVVTAALMLLGLGDVSPRDRPVADGDRDLYARIINQVHAGEPYDQAVLHDLRAVDGPTRPFLTVRPPLLATAMAALPDRSSRVLSLRLLAAVVVLAWFWRLRAAPTAPAGGGWALLLALTSGVGLAVSPAAYVMHELWAGLLIALSLALRTPGRWLAAVAVGVLAALIRELAAPYLVAMMVVALAEGRRKEALGWVSGLAVFAAALTWHAAAVRSLALPTDHAGPGWLAVGGWPFVLHTASWNLMTILFPPALLAGLFPIALLGLAFWRDGLGRRVALTVLGYTAAFLVIGRPVNFYWGLIMAPLWPLGLAKAPEALGTAWRWIAAGGKRPRNACAGASPAP